MQKRPVGMGAFAFEVGQKIAAQLPGPHEPDHQRTGEAFPRLNRRAARQEAAHIAHLARG